MRSEVLGNNNEIEKDGITRRQLLGGSAKLTALAGVAGLAGLAGMTPKAAVAAAKNRGHVGPGDLDVGVARVGQRHLPEGAIRQVDKVSHDVISHVDRLDCAIRWPPRAPPLSGLLIARS